MKEVDSLTINTLPSPHVASSHLKDTYCYYRPCNDDPKKHYGFKLGLLGKSASLGLDISNLEMFDWGLESKEVSPLGKELSLFDRPNEVERGRILEAHRLEPILQQQISQRMAPSHHDDCGDGVTINMRRRHHDTCDGVTTTPTASNAQVIFDEEKRNNPPQHPRIVYPPILNINYFRHFLDILRNYDPMDDEPMWDADRVVALTLGSAITISKTANEFSIKGNHLTLIKGNQFDGRTKTDPHKHIHEFLRICDMFKYRDTENEAVRLMMFPLSLTGEEKTWLDKLNKGTIKMWVELRTTFILRSFPVSFDGLLEKSVLFPQEMQSLNQCLASYEGNAQKLPWSQSFQRQYYQNLLSWSQRNNPRSS
ncbi:hypothetical protein Tco_0936733 [Tanacetum coccineum]|uniref:Reverse transcriptase domain-containing protein n=1 Tax=Tanacetum coccineum TaxID=301880 RepID=A0ABQ5DEZ6_9ASTR